MDFGTIFKDPCTLFTCYDFPSWFTYKVFSEAHFCDNLARCEEFFVIALFFCCTLFFIGFNIVIFFSFINNIGLGIRGLISGEST